MFHGLVVAMDVSEDGPRVVALIVAREHDLKMREFLNNVSWLKHFRKIHPREKRSYLAKLPKRFLKVSRYLLYVKIFTNMEDLLNYTEQFKQALLLVDDKLLGLVGRRSATVVREGNIRYKHHKALMILADNLANYFRIVLKEKPRRFRNELKRFEK